MLNVLIYDDSWMDRLKLKKIIRNYAINNNIKLKFALSTICPDKILKHSFSEFGLYFLNIDDLEKKMDGIMFAADIRNNDFDGSIVFISEHDIFAAGRVDLSVRSFRSNVIAMSFLAKDSINYENEIKSCIAAHMHKKSLFLNQIRYSAKM